MTHWDEIAEAYDRLTIHSYLGGRVRCGYPPSVGSVDMWKKIPGGNGFLSDDDLIGVADASDGTCWTFAFQRVSLQDVHELPGGRQLVIDRWLLDPDRPRVLGDAPVFPVRGTITNAALGHLYLYDHAFVVCYGARGLVWRSAGLFEADMISVQLTEGKVICRGYMNWVEPDRTFTLQLDAVTGAIIGGDAEARECYG